jgi:hypothetical protein
MRLTYKILWFENDDTFYDSLNLDEIREHLGLKGFEATVERRLGEEPLEQMKADARRSDLIVMDFALEGQQGDELIGEIRDGNINTEIVFYSAAGVGKLRDAVRTRELDGVYCRGRDDITTDILPIIDSTIRKVLDLENSRGLVMAELGDLDTLMNDIIMTVHDRDEANKVFIRKNLKTKVERQNKSFAKSLEKFDELTIHEIVEGLLDSSKRLNTMISIANELELNDYPDRLKGYEQSVFFPRNCLAHGIPQELEDGGYRFGHRGKEFVYNDESSTQLRNDFRDFKSCLHELQALVAEPRESTSENANPKPSET